MKKYIDVKISEYDYFGRGISKEEGKVCFVPKARIGFSGTCEIEKEKKHFCEAILQEKDREEVDCPFFYQCGGCQLRHLTCEEQQDFKVRKVKSLLQRNAGIKIEDLRIETPISNRYRNKVVFHLENGQVGFFKEGTNVLLPIDRCLLLTKRMHFVLEELRSFALKNPRPMTVTVRELSSKVMMSILEEKTHPFTYPFFTVDSLFYQGELKKGEAFLEVEVLGVTYRVSKDAFFQVNLKGMEVLYKKVLFLLEKVHAKKVIDLYCGVGSISLVAAKVVEEVFGVEVVESAVLNAKENARSNQITNATFKCGKVEALLSILPEGYDTVIVDPPRKGLDNKTKEFLLENPFQHLIYVSCDAATLARDIKDLSCKYTLEKIELVDMFPNTYHVETVCVLERR